MGSLPTSAGRLQPPVRKPRWMRSAIVANWESDRGDVPAYCTQVIAYSFGVKVADILPDLTFKGLIAGRIMAK